MDWKLAVEEERATLKRIVALLLALADLAELACSRSRAVRGFVLWFLRHAETVAQNFVAGAPDTWLAPTTVEPLGGWQADAMHLAGSFRALAWLLARQAKLALAVPCEDSREPEPLPPGPKSPTRDILSALSTIAGFAGNALGLAPDTS